MQIAREILTDVSTTDVDVAVFNDIQSNYTIGRDLLTGTLTVTHTTLTDPAVDDGTDTLRNFERVRFADGEVSVALLLNQPFERLNITFANGDVGTLTATFTGRDLTRPVTLQWQSLGADGTTWTAIPGATGTQFTPGAALAGVEVRVVAGWTSTVPGSLGPRTTASVETGIVGTPGVVDEDIVGSTAPNVILGLEGNDRIEGDIGNDHIDGGDGDDRVDGNDGDDILRGNDGDDIVIGRDGNNVLFGDAGNDTLSGGHGNDSLDGGDGVAGELDTAVVSGPVEAYTFDRNAQGAILVTDNLGVEGDGADTLRRIEQFQDGDDVIYTLVDAAVAPAGVVTGTAAADIVVGTAGANQLVGGAADDLIFGAGGDDTIRWNAGDGRDFVDGGAGNDRFWLASPDGVDVYETMAAARLAFPTADLPRRHREGCGAQRRRHRGAEERRAGRLQHRADPRAERLRSRDADLGRQFHHARLHQQQRRHDEPLHHPLDRSPAMTAAPPQAPSRSRPAAP